MRAPDELVRDLAQYKGKTVRLDQASAADALTRQVAGSGGKPVRGPDPIALMKAVKNHAEIVGSRAAHQRDGVAMARFLAWLEREAPSGNVTEIDAVEALESFRRDTGLLKDISFPTIAGSGPNGAIVHYRVTRASNRTLGKNELFLIDSGAQYEDGTTDITRTVVIGTPSDEMRDRFTRVLKGHIAIATAVFPENTSGAQLDPLARTALWQAGLDFDHGTGHGVGSYLSVHEGPARISKLGTVALKRGMILSNEPGYYKTAAYGIRIENLLLVIAAPEPAGAEKPLNAFETLTLAPIDRRLIDTRMLTAKERNWVDSYHAHVQEVLGPLLDAPTRAWLDAATRPLGNRLMDARTSTSPPQSKQATPWRLLALLMAMTAIGPATLNILVPALPGLVTRLASDTGTVQLTLSLYLLSLAAAQLLLGPLSDRFGRRPVVLAGLTLSVVASLAAIAASSIGALIGARVVQAVGASTGIVIGRAIIRDLYERERAAAMIGLVTTAMVIAPMISPLIGGILDTAFGWEAIFLFIAAFSGVVLLWAVLVLPETRPASVAQDARHADRAMARAHRQRQVPWLRAVRRARLGAVLHVSRRRPARGGDADGAHLGRIRRLVRDHLARLYERQLHRLAAVAALRRRRHDHGRHRVRTRPAPA